MAITPTSISKRYKLLNAGNLDWWWGPWASIAQANTALPSTLDADGVNVRQGKFVAIGNSVEGYVVHWWNNNYTDGGLIPYSASNVQLIITVDTYEEMLTYATGSASLKIYVREPNQYVDPPTENSYDWFTYTPNTELGDGISYKGVDPDYKD